jgi:hypothetical protein
MIEFTHDDIDNWLVEYTNKNEDIENTLQNLSIDHREIKHELFNIKVKQEVIVAPLRNYIQEWLNNSISKISEIPTEAVTTGNLTATRKGTKETKKKMKRERFHHSKSMLITYFFPYQFFIQLFFFFN